MPSFIGNKPGQFSINPALLPHAVGEWMLMEDLIYTSKSGKQFVTPKYFLTDLASIPWIAEPFFKSIDTRLPGIVHDGLYCMNRISRSECDNLLAEMLDVTGCSPTLRNLIYTGVRVGGASRYEACKGGPKLEDFAWECMNPYEVTLYKTAYKIK